MNTTPATHWLWKSRGQECGALLLATLLWLPLVHWLFVRPEKSFSPREAGLAPKAQAWAARHLQQLHTTLEFAAFPRRESGRLKYCASNQVADAVMLCSSVLGPVWQRVQKGKGKG